MKHTLEIWYLVSDGGDGSAYPQFYESKECTELADELSMLRGSNFAETCNGSIELESDSPITCKRDVTTMVELVSEFKDIYFAAKKRNDKNQVEGMEDVAEMYNIDLTPN